MKANRIFGLVGVLVLLIAASFGCGTASDIATSAATENPSPATGITTPLNATPISSFITATSYETVIPPETPVVSEDEQAFPPEDSTDGDDADSYSPELTDPPGVWIPDSSMGNQEPSDLSKTMAFDPQPAERNPDIGEILAVQKITFSIDGWEYYFDTARPVSNEDRCGYPLCRKGESGIVEDLGIFGFDMVSEGDFIYVYTNSSSGDFPHWDTWRVSLDGNDKEYCGVDIILVVPESGNYLYFTGYDYDIYRSDYMFKKIERIRLGLPDTKDIEDKISPHFTAFDEIIVDGEWLVVDLYAYNLDGDSYSGKYKMPLSGGEVVKTNTGEYSLFGTDGEE